jgi:predicted phosphodiesterase
MKVVVIADVHANLEALEALPETYTELWVLGDLVGFGPDPAAVIDFLRAKIPVVVRGNHDHSVGVPQPNCCRKLVSEIRRVLCSGSGQS